MIELSEFHRGIRTRTKRETEREKKRERERERRRKRLTHINRAKRESKRARGEWISMRLRALSECAHDLQSIPRCLQRRECAEM